MSIAMVTKGRLWPIGSCKAIREQFTDIHAVIQDPYEVTSVVEDEVAEVSFSIEMDAISVKIEVEDDQTVTVTNVIDVSSDIKDC